MVDQSPGETSTEAPVLGYVEEPLTLRTIGSAMLGGLAGVVVMSPVIAGIPILLGVFQLSALAAFADLVISQANTLLGILFFLAGGVIMLPLFFVVTATYLPPYEPRYLRGATISTFFWVPFVFVFWPDGTLAINAIYVVVTLVSHWIYGAVLGLVMERLTGIPEHRV